MFYIDRGRGPVFLLIHGMFGDHLDWAPVIAPLAEHHRVIAVDLPGFGDSEKPDIEFTPAFFTAELNRLLDSLGVASCTVVGNSFGGQLAMALALDAPERVERLVLITTGSLHRYTAQELQFSADRMSEANLIQFTPAYHAAIFGRLFYNPDAPHKAAYIAKQDAKLLRPDYPAYARIISRCARLSLEYCLLEEIHRIGAPVLLLQGEQDPIVSAQWIRAAAPLFPDATLAMIPECGHIPQIEIPDKVIGLVEQFLSRTSAVSPAV